MDNTFLYNNKILRDRRRDLRNNQTLAELALWSKLKNSQLNGLKFVRQYSVGPYILDFYCPKLRLAIELDGSVHSDNEAKLYDKDRDKYLKSVDIHTIRFWNNEVLKNIGNVFNLLNKQINTRSSSPSS